MTTTTDSLFFLPLHWSFQAICSLNQCPQLAHIYLIRYIPYMLNVIQQKQMLSLYFVISIAVKLSNEMYYNERMTLHSKRITASCFMSINGMDFSAL